METLANQTDASGLRFAVEDGVARVEIDLPGEKVNKLTSAWMAEFEALLDRLATAEGVRAVVLASGKPDTFIAGADIGEIEALASFEEARDKSRFGQRVFAKIEALGKPVVAAIHGACLGGGCELVLACHGRLASDDPATKLGLPEVKLGIVPGFGGTQRLPQVVGLQAALDLVLTGRVVDARRALGLGMVDALVYRGLLVDEAGRTARRLADLGRFRSARPSRRPLLSVPGLLDRTAPGRELLLNVAARRVRKETRGHYPAPLAAIDALRAGVRSGGKAYARETELLARMALTSESRHLLQLFRLTESNKRVGRDLPAPAPVRQIAVIGAGVMGGGIAQLAAAQDLGVRLKDIQPEALLVALRTARDLMQKLAGRRRLGAGAVENKLARISTTLDYSGFRLADVVIEAVVERMDVKRRVLQETEAEVRPECVLATNTSALSVTQMGAGLRDPGRLVGLHFFNPVHRMPLVEIVRGEQTRPETVATVLALARLLGKTPVIVRDAPGFLVNRILAPFLNEASFLFEAGQDIEHLDRAMRRFGMPMGPFELIDEVGTDVAAEVGRTLHEGLGERMRPAALAARLVEARRLGRKSGAGVYRYEGKKRRPEPELWVTLRGRPGASPLPESAVQERIFALMINEAARCLDERIAASAGDMDLALVFGIGFPPFRGGLLRYADTLGIATLVRELERLERDVGPRFAPCARLRRMADTGETFHAPLRTSSVAQPDPSVTSSTGRGSAGGPTNQRAR